MTESDYQKSEVKRLDGRVNRVERDVSELWSQFNTYRDTSRADITSLREHVVSEYKEHIRGVEGRMKEYVDNADQSMSNKVTLRFIGYVGAIVVIVQAVGIYVQSVVG